MTTNTTDVQLPDEAIAIDDAQFAASRSWRATAAEHSRPTATISVASSPVGL